MAKLYFKVASDWEEVVRLRNEIGKLKQELKNMDSTQTPAAFKTLNTQLAASTQRMDEIVTGAAKAGAAMEGDFKKMIFDASQTVNGFTEKIIAQKAVVKDTEADVKRLGEAYRTALKRNPLSASGKLEEYKSAKRALDEEKAALFGLTQQQANARLAVKKLRDEYSLYKNDGKQVIETNKGIGLSLGKALGVIGGIATLKQLSSEIIRVRGEFQSMQTAIETLVGKDMAGQLIPQIKELAKISPLTMSDMVGAEKMMLGFNIQAEDTIKYLKALSDISMGESSKFNSLTLAFSQMSATGKLMGQDLNQMINAGFNPLQTISEKTGKSIAALKDEMSKGAISAEMVQQAFLDATSAGGKFYNMSENASKTINGQLSMMQDALDNVFNELGTKGEGVITSGIQTTTSLIQNYETVGKVLAGLVLTYGAYRTAVMLATAAESKHTLVEIGLTNARILARKAQMALNASMLANPYVLLAVAVGGLVTAMWAMSDSTTAAARAQKEYNDIKEKASKQEQEHKQKIDELLTAARDESLATLTRQKSLEELRKEYPKIFEQYDLEKLKLTDLLELKKQINEEESKRSVEGKKTDYSSLKQTVSNQQRFLQLKDNPDLRKNMSDADKDVWKMFAGKQSYVKVREEMQKNAEMLKLLQKDIIADNIASYKAELKNYSKEKLEAELKMAQSDAAKRNGYNVGGFMIKGSDLDGVISSINGTLAEKKSPSTYKADYEKAKKDWNEAKAKLADIEKDKSKFTTKQYEEAKKLKESTEKRFKDLGGDTKGVGEKASVKAMKQENSIISQSEKIAEIERKQAIDRQRQQEDLENQIAQSRIDAMDKGYEKEQAQRELNNKKEILSLQRQKEDYISAYIQAQKELFDAQEDLKAKKDSKYKKKTFDSSSVSVDTTAFDAVIDNISQRQLNDKIREQEESWNDYLIKFGNYQQKRKAIIEKYDKEIAEAKTAGEAAILEKEKENALDDLDNSVKNSATLMGQLFADASQKSANEIQKIIEKAELLMQYLGTVKDEQGNAQIGGKTVSKKDIIDLGISDNTLQNLEMSTEEVEALRSAIDKLKGNLGAKSPFKLFETQISSAIEKISQGGKKNIAQGITEIGTSITSFAPNISQFGQDLGNIFGNDELGDKISGVADVLGGLGQTAAGVGQIMAGDIVGGAMSAVSGISSIVSAFDGLFGANYDKYNKAKEEYESYISVLDDVIEKQKEMVASLDTQNASNTYDYAKSLIEKSAEAARTLGKERLNAGASAGSHSIGVRIRKDMSSEGWNEAKKALGAEFNNATEGRMTGLFDLSVEQLEKLQAEAPTFWAKLDDDVRTYLEDIIAANKSAEDLKDTLNESLTGISFDSLFDNFLESLYDMESSAEDISDDMADYLRKSLIKAFAVENYKGKMQEWYTKWAEAMKDGEISLEEQKSLDDLKNSIITGATESAKLINDQFEYLKKDSSQSSSKGGFQAMSQDTGDELNGRFTALQMAGEEIKAQNTLQAESLNILTVRADAILSVNTETRNIADEIRTVQVNSYLELQEIRQNTGDTVKQLKSMDEKLKKIESNTNKL